MKRVAVLGGGPAGAYAAELLARGGVRVALFDEKLAWEKPCGGGLSQKAFLRYPFLADGTAPKRWVHRLRFTADDAGNATLDLDHPLLLYARRDLNQLLLWRAELAGAQLEKERVTAMEPHGCGWRIRTARGSFEADACVVATGARNSLRSAGTEFGPNDSMVALGYYVDGAQPDIDLVFARGLHGYIWVFPRCDHLSVGICGKQESSASLRNRLENLMRERGISWKGAQFYAHLLPSLEPGSWSRNRIGGPGWLAVGDAGGFVDPITGEGIYYAIRSAELAAQAMLQHGRDAAAGYRAALQADMVEDLALGSAIAPRFYRGCFLRSPVTARMIQFARRSPRFASLLRELVAGSQGYRGLARRLWWNLLPTFYEIASHTS
jgi:geranylgeranyl reductase family protein